MLSYFILKNHFSEFESLFLQHGGKREAIKSGKTLYNANNKVPNQISYYIKSGIAKLSIIKENGVENWTDVKSPTCFFIFWYNLLNLLKS